MTRNIGFIAKKKNELPVASQYFIDFLLVHAENLS